MKNILGFLLTILVFTQCQHAAAIDIATCTGTTPTYSANIKAIMNASCATSGCHDASSKASGYDLSSYAGTSNAASSAAFLGSIQHKAGYSSMPRGAAQLPDSVINKIACWVQNATPQ